MFGASFAAFLAHDANSIPGELVRASHGSVDDTQRDAWLVEIDLIQNVHHFRDDCLRDRDAPP